jgi:hypothetical protein
MFLSARRITAIMSRCERELEFGFFLD